MIIITQSFLTQNDCYKQGRSINPIGIVVHSTGTNNTNLKRYIQPNDGQLGTNNNDNHWNKSGVSKCVHAFIGQLENGQVATYQTLPWNMRCWGCGSGSKGSYNNGFIQFEICEDNLTSESYFNEVYQQAAELCAHLMKLYPAIKLENIVCHSEARDLGYASNHADVMHWFPKHGKSMNTFRQQVQYIYNTAYNIPKLTNPYKVPTRTIYYRKLALLKGDDVKYVQYVIGVSCDGKCGPATDKAIRSWQKANKLTVDGKFGPACRKVAAKLYA